MKSTSSLPHLILFAQAEAKAMRVILGTICIALLVPVLRAYDYVIIGGGTGYAQFVTVFHGLLTTRARGLTVANRLSEDPSVSVIVIEAGPNAEDLPEVTYMIVHSP